MEFHWINESTIRKSADRWEITAPRESDFFCNNGAVGEEGITPESLSNAPFYYYNAFFQFACRGNGESRASGTGAYRERRNPYIRRIDD